MEFIHQHYVPVVETKTTLSSNLPIKKRKLTLISSEDDVIGTRIVGEQKDNAHLQRIHASAIVKELPRKLEMANQNSTPGMRRVSLPIKLQTLQTAIPNLTPAMVRRTRRKLEREKAKDIPTTAMLRVMQRKIEKEKSSEKRKEIPTPAMREVMLRKLERANEAKTKNTSNK